MMVNNEIFFGEADGRLISNPIGIGCYDSFRRENAQWRPKEEGKGRVRVLIGFCFGVLPTE